MGIRERIIARADLDAMRAARDITSLAAALNAENLQEVQERFVTARAVLACCSDGATILDALETASASNSAVKWAVKFLGQEAGLNIGDPYTQGMIDQLVTGAVLTQAQGDDLKNLALKTTIVTPEQVANAMYNLDGTEK